MLLQGRYIAENTDSILDQYRIIMIVKETEKSYVFTLEDFQSQYSGAHIEMLFSKSKRVIIKKDRGGHAIRRWSDGSFTLYPFQAGIPYCFTPYDSK